MMEFLTKTRGMCGFRHFSMMNPWIDFVVLVPESFKSVARTAILGAMESYWDFEYECYGDAVEDLLFQNGIPFVIFYHDSEDLSDEYEEAWELAISMFEYEVI